MKVFLDANFLIYLKYSQDDEIFNYCIDLLRELENHTPLTNMVVIDEVVWILNKKYGIETNEVSEFVDKILNIASIISIGGEHWGFMREAVLKFNLKPSDALHVATMKRSEIKYIITEDSDFDKVEGTSRIWLGRGELIGS